VNQPKHQSFVESLCNVGSGFLVALLFWIYHIMPCHIEPLAGSLAFSDNLHITAEFTIISVVRGYIWRRIFNWWLMVRRMA